MKVLLCMLLASGSALAQEPPSEAELAEEEAALGVPLKACIDAGHEWLKKHQEKDGHFSASMFVVHDPKGQPCDGPGKPDQDVFVTSMVAHSWHGMGWTSDANRTHEFQCRAIDWLDSQVQEDGSVGLAGSQTLVRDTAIAAEVLYSANRYYGGRATRLDKAATQDWLVEQRLPSGLWPAASSSKQRDDWLATNLAAQMLCQLDGKLVDWSNLTGFGDQKSKTFGAGEAGAAAYLAAWYVRSKEKRSEYCSYALKHLPTLHTREDGVDYFGWFGTTQAMQFEDSDRWQMWWHALTDTALATQRTDGPFAGSWDPLDVRGRQCGRIYSTAATLLALEVVWRKQYRDK